MLAHRYRPILSAWVGPLVFLLLLTLSSDATAQPVPVPRQDLSPRDALAPLRARVADLEQQHQLDLPPIPMGQTEAEYLHELFDLWWRYWMIVYPTWATSLGYPGQDTRWTDDSVAANARRDRELNLPWQAIHAIDRAKLNTWDQDHYDLFKRRIQSYLEGIVFPGDYLALHQLSGVHLYVPRVLNTMPATTVAHYDAMLARLRGVPTLVDQTIIWLEKGMEAGVTTPRIVLRRVPEQILKLMTVDPFESAILKPFTKIPASVAKAEQDRLRAEAKAVFEQHVKPAYQTLLTFLQLTYTPRARDTVGWSDLPNGKAWYAYLVRRHTTTDLTPQQIHDLGKAEVKRIDAEMRALAASTHFEDYDSFVEFLKTDPQFYLTDRESNLAAFRDLAKRADPEMVKLFGRLPRMPYGIRPVPAYKEKSAAGGYYRKGSHVAGRPGYFYVNLSSIRGFPTWQMEALTLHEAVPGHHLQLSLALELDDMPEFRKHTSYTAFVEGWGLYAERLGLEMGFYQDVYAQYGRLSFEIWRAIRLVVDTGIHALGWSRQQAMNYTRRYAGTSGRKAVDRYIVWPGQALSYKIGELKILELRALAESRLGERFDIRAFHDQMLSRGGLPLDVLERFTKAWIVDQEQSGQ